MKTVIVFPYAYHIIEFLYKNTLPVAAVVADSLVARSVVVETPPKNQGDRSLKLRSNLS